MNKYISSNGKLVVEEIRKDDNDVSSYGFAAFRETWRDAQGKAHREGEPAITVRSTETGEVLGQEWRIHGQLHRMDGPAHIHYRSSGYIDREWHVHGLLHRDDGPARETIKASGDIPPLTEEWYRAGQRHREGAPAHILRSEHTGVIFAERWAVADMTHRVDGPAYIERNETTGKILEEQWIQVGQPHRTDGPALIDYDPETGDIIEQSYYRDGVEVTPPDGPGL